MAAPPPAATWKQCLLTAELLDRVGRDSPRPALTELSTSRYRSPAPGRCLADQRPGRGGQGRVNTVDAMFRLRDRRPHQA
jgi:hypothetical protein